MATHSSVLTWRIPGMVEPGRLLSLGSHRVVIPLRSSLPEKCFSVSEYSNDLIQIAKGESGFAFEHRELGALTPREAADRLNRELGVTKAQEQAMVAGSMFGWAAPAADPINYDETGKALRPKQLERGDTR